MDLNESGTDACKGTDPKAAHPRRKDNLCHSAQIPQESKRLEAGSELLSQPGGCSVEVGRYCPDVRDLLSKREREVLSVLFLQTVGRRPARLSVRMKLAQLQWACACKGKDFAQVIDALVSKRAIQATYDATEAVYEFRSLPLERSLVRIRHTAAEWQRWDEEVEYLNSGSQVALNLVTEQAPLAETAADVAAQSKGVRRMSDSDWLSALRGSIENPEAYPELPPNVTPENRESALPKIGSEAPENREATPENREAWRNRPKSAVKPLQNGPPENREATPENREHSDLLNVNVLRSERERIKTLTLEKVIHNGRGTSEVFAAVRVFVGEYDWEKYWVRNVPRLEDHAGLLWDCLQFVIESIRLGLKTKVSKGARLWNEFRARRDGLRA